MITGVIAMMFATALLAMVAPAPVSAAVPGYQSVPGRTAMNSQDTKTLSISCPAGKSAISASYDLLGAEGQVVLTNMNVNASGVFLAASESQNKTTVNWSIVGSALCVNPLPGLEYQQGNGQITRGPRPGVSVSATASCTAGKRLIGVGANVTAGTDGQVSMSNLVLGDTGATVFGIEDQDGFDASWGPAVTAVCANPLSGLRIVLGRGSSLDSNIEKFDSPRCGDGTNDQRALAAGWAVGGSGQVVVFSLATGILGTNVSAAEDQDGFAGLWSVNGSVICANLTT